MSETTFKATRCPNCGGSEFLLLASGKYQCKNCGTNILPQKLNVQQVNLQNSLSGFGTVLKKILLPAIILLFVVAFFFYLTLKAPSSDDGAALQPARVYQETSAPQDIENLTLRYSEVKVQQRRIAYQTYLRNKSPKSEALFKEKLQKGELILPDNYKNKLQTGRPQ